MEEEKIIRSEAHKFYNLKIGGGGFREPIDQFHLLKSRLLDFYPPASKAIFLDEIKASIISNLIEHRAKAQGGNAKA
ncbi:MAG: hypothetical protein IPL74_04250 [Bacteroidetes bacterium]|nr:hypothetical protein [Bacteroidota bacterium]